MYWKNQNSREPITNDVIRVFFNSREEFNNIIQDLNSFENEDMDELASILIDNFKDIRPIPKGKEIYEGWVENCTHPTTALYPRHLWQLWNAFIELLTIHHKMILEEMQQVIDAREKTIEAQGETIEAIDRVIKAQNTIIEIAEQAMTENKETADK